MYVRRTLQRMWASLSPRHRRIAKIVLALDFGALALLIVLGSYVDAAYCFVALSLMMVVLARLFMAQSAS